MFLSFKKMIINLLKYASDPILFVYAGAQHLYVQYEASMTICVYSIPHQRKLPKWLLFNNYNDHTCDVQKRDTGAYLYKI